MKPLRVTIKLAEPIAASTFPRLLDGLLAHCAVEDALTFCDDENDQRPLRELGDELPLQRVEGCAEKVWKASAFMPVGRITDDCSVDHFSVTGHTQIRKLIRRSDVHEIARLTGLGFIPARGFDPDKPKHGAIQLDTARGLLKESAITYALKHVHAIEAWCIGEQDHIEALLTHVEFLGAKRRLGHGKVQSIEVVEDERANRLWELRPLPMDAKTSSAAPACLDRIPAFLPPRAPYWDRKFAVEQGVPSAMFW